MSYIGVQEGEETMSFKHWGCNAPPLPTFSRDLYIAAHGRGNKGLQLVASVLEIDTSTSSTAYLILYRKQNQKSTSLATNREKYWTSGTLSFCACPIVDPRAKTMPICGLEVYVRRDARKRRTVRISLLMKHPSYSRVTTLCRK